MRGPAVRQLAKYVLINCHNVVCSTYVLCVGRANIFEKKYLWSKEIRHKIVDFSFDGLLPLHTMGFSHLRQGLSGRGGGRHIPSQSWTGRRRRRRRRMLPFLIWWSDSALLPQNINNQFPSSLSRDGKKKGNTPGSTTTKKQYLSLLFFSTKMTFGTERLTRDAAPINRVFILRETEEGRRILSLSLSFSPCCLVNAFD